MPIQTQTLNDAIKEAKAKLLKIANSLDQFEFPKLKTTTFDTTKIDVDEIVKGIPVGSDLDDFIYIFKIIGQNHNNKKLVEKLESEKEKQVDEYKKDLPRINTDNIGSQYLYVGRSHKLRSRLRQHIDDKYHGTYAMHLKRWVTELKEQIEIQYFQLENRDNLLIQTIEDSLWDKLKPCFGRKGDK